MKKRNGILAATDEYKIDGHKLIYHIPRLYQWLRGKEICPIYAEIGLVGSCNHRCIFCAFDYLNYKPEIMDEVCLRRFLADAARRGVKAVLYSGEGEPLLHPRAPQIIAYTREKGIDVALVTNGVFLTEEKSATLLKHLTWVKVSIDAASPRTYARIHGTKEEDFALVIRNLREAVKIRNARKYPCTIGAQFLLMPQNFKETEGFVRLMKGAGIDYAAIKPYCQHPASAHCLATGFSYKGLSCLEQRLQRYADRGFRVVFRRQAMQKSGEPKPYRRCLGLPFAVHITAKGEVYPCNTFVGRKEFCLGNICGLGLSRFWRGQRREKILRFLSGKWDVSRCRDVCRLDEINRYLWELRNPGRHVNFI